MPNAHKVPLQFCRVSYDIIYVVRIWNSSTYLDPAEQIEVGKFEVGLGYEK
jgi:hypothetical protein